MSYRWTDAKSDFAHEHLGHLLLDTEEWFEELQGYISSADEEGAILAISAEVHNEHGFVRHAKTFINIGGWSILDFFHAFRQYPEMD